MADNSSGFVPGAFPPFKLFDGKDKDHEACRSLWVAVIQKAIKDMAYTSQKRDQRSLTPSEREKLHRIYELEAPENFFNSPWFEEICLFLELSPSRIRGAVFDRYEDANGRRHPLI
jgi:hypothetical protein